MIKVNKLIQKLNDELKQLSPAYKGVYLFGSRIKNNVAGESDIDLVFVFEDKINQKLEEEVWDIVYNFDLKYDIVIDAKVYELKDIQFLVTPFRATVLKEGKYYAV